MATDVASLAHELREQIAHDAVLGHSAKDHLHFVQIEAAFLPKVAQYLRDRKSCPLFFDLIGTHLLDSSETPEGSMELIYRVGGVEPYKEICLKIELRSQEARVQSVSKIWPAADWAEREVSELLGIVFEGNENPHNFLLPQGWQGKPLKRDYVYPDGFDGLERQKQPLRKQHSRT